MKKITVLLTALACVFSFANVSMAQEQEASSDVVVNNDAALKKRPAPIPRAHIVEDYLPILGKQARANGIRPPKPFFISAIYYHMEIPQTITNARGWGFYGYSEQNAIGVRMENAKIETNSAGFRAGFNLLPFMSIFGVYMHTEGQSKFTAVADGNAAMPNGYMLNQTLKFKADTGAIGTALSYGFRLGRVMPYAVLNVNYAWTKTDRTDNIINTLIAGARVGMRVPLPKNMSIGAHIGTQYQYMPMGNQVHGRYSVTLPAGTTIFNPDRPETVTSEYKADAKYASPWVMTAGVIFSPSRYFDVLAEFGFLSRFTAMVAVQANF